MFRKALIPLDTSEAAEKVIPYVKQIISKEETELLLVNATKPNMFRYAFPTHEPSLEAKLSATATDFRKRYLHRLLDSLIAQGYRATAELIDGDPARCIIDTAMHRGVDLIAMTTHGRSGLTRWALGSVADRVIRGAAQPILLVRHSDELTTSRKLERIVVPLDGSEVAEEVLRHAQTPAKESGASITLLRVVEPLASWEVALLIQVGEYVNTLQSDRISDAEAYLNLLHKRLTAENIPNDIEIYTGTPATAILEVATEKECNLFGFHIWRSKDGDRANAVRITPEMILAKGNNESGGHIFFL